MVHRPQLGLYSPAPFISRCVFALTPPLFRNLLRSLIPPALLRTASLFFLGSARPSIPQSLKQGIPAIRHSCLAALHFDRAATLRAP